ncbi:MAG: ECF transporter S component [Clostridia bacterium]|nr:ECF transporter S component [Clostridia bacterium]
MAAYNYKNSIKKICLAGVFMALNIALSSFGVPVPGGHLYLNDIVICTAAILLDPLLAFFVGGVGSFLGDLFFYPTPMFVSLVTHGIQAVVISVFANYILKEKKALSSAIGVSIGAVIMVVGYSLGRAFIYGTVAYAIAKLPFQILQAVLGAVVSMIICFNFGLIKKIKKFGF